MLTQVSQGAELIMISKEFFMKNATEQVQRYIREEVQPYPSENALQVNLQREVNWRLFRQDTVDDIMKDITASRCSSKPKPVLT